MQVLKKHICTINNKKIYKVTFSNNNNYSIEFYNFGGYLNSINIPYVNNINKKEDVILGYNNFEKYLDDKSSLNALVGRICGRIRNAQFVLNKKKYYLDQNDKPHHIHGGYAGFGKKVWEIDKIEESNDFLSCTLKYFSPHLEEGYPGNLDCVGKYTINNKNEFQINFSARADRDTIVNLTNHNYWNFHGHNSSYQNIKNHYVQINADKFCELDAEYMPTGNFNTVDNTKFDFRVLKNIDDNILHNDGVDICYITNKENKIQEVATVYSKLTKMGMVLSSDQPGLQFYTGNMMENEYHGKNGKKYGYQYGLCMEAQLFPDAINQPNFKSPLLKSGDTYSSKIVMALRNDF